jgi:hypothetical protein
VNHASDKFSKNILRYYIGLIWIEQLKRSGSPDVQFSPAFE